MDNKENWPKGDTVDGENKIVLFHGPVNKAQTDIGYTVSSNSFTVDMFDGFDMVMLGDIHKRQTFGKGYEHVAYAGSMIQQNHGELLRIMDTYFGIFQHELLQNIIFTMIMDS